MSTDEKLTREEKQRRNDLECAHDPCAYDHTCRNHQILAEVAKRLREWIRVPKDAKWPARSLDDDLDEAAALLEQRSGGQWISVSERLPDEDGRLWAVLSDTVNLGIVTGYYPLCEYYHFNDGWATDERITHWLDVKLPPLPAAPQGWSES
jgi:hypothetical protein